MSAMAALERCRSAWERQDQQGVLDLYPDRVLNGDADASPLGVSVEHAEPTACRGPAHASLTAASTLRTGNRSLAGASACSPYNREETK